MKPGQRYPKPDKNDGLCRFYMSLYRQNKNSKMALNWCLTHGLFKTDVATNMCARLELEKLEIANAKKAKDKTTKTKKN
jgi:hypothetical protein